MKRLFKMLFGLIVILVLAFALGPRPDTTIELTFDANSIGDDLETYLKDSEASVANLTEGAEKEIIWADPVGKTKTPISIVYIHGFSATKHEIQPVPENVAKALSANLFFTRLTGHGSDGEALATATLSDWANDFSEAIAIGERLGDKVIVIATSNGAAISTWGMLQPSLSDRIFAAAFLSANFELQTIGTTVANMPWAETLLPLLGGKEYSWEAYNDEQDKWWTNAYPSKAIFPMTSLLKVLDASDVSKIKVPTLFVYSPEDTVIAPQRIEQASENWGAQTELYQVPSVKNPSKHVIAGDIMAPENTENVSVKITQWLESLKL